MRESAIWMGLGNSGLIFANAHTYKNRQRALMKLKMPNLLFRLCQILLCAGVLWLPSQARAFVDCETMAAQIGRSAGLPDGILPAIARIESGRRMNGQTRAWPWTMNHAGKGLYFDSRAKALAYLQQATVKGKTNIDVGCMQINHRWHGDAFPSLSAMLDPVQNIQYAVQFLKRLYARTGSWEMAVRHYHSPKSQHNNRYIRAYRSAMKDMQNGSSGQADYLIGAGSAPIFGMARPGFDQPIMSTQSGAAARMGVDETYAHLLAVLARSEGSTGVVFGQFADLTEQRETRGVLHKNWDKVQAFRDGFARGKP